MGPTPERSIADFFDSLGLIRASIDGRLYPITRRAESVRDVLLGTCTRENVAIECACTPMVARYDKTARTWSLSMPAPANRSRPSQA